MIDPPEAAPDNISPAYRKTVYRRHFQGAVIRSAASVVLWVFALLAFITGNIRGNHFWGITFCVFYLVLINPPTLLLFRYLRRRRHVPALSLTINFLEIVGYTAIIYFLGGFEAAYLIPIYAAIITYVGIMSPRNFPFIVAGLSSVTFAAMVALEYTGILPHQNIQPTFHMDPGNLLFNTLVVAALLFVVAYIASYTAGLLKRNRDQLVKQNLALEEKTKTITRAQQELREANETLELRVQDRTKELSAANEQLTREIQDRKEAQLSAKASEARYLDLFNNVHDFLYQHDLDGTFTEYNQVFRDTFCVPERGKARLNVRDIMPEEFRPQFEHYLARVMERGTDEGYFKALAQDEKEIIVEYKNLLVRDADGNIIGVHGSGRDVTERILAARERKRLETQMIRAQRMEALGTLAGGIAHNFNNLLMGIVGNASMAGLQLEKDHPALAHLQKIEALTQSGSKLTRELLGYVREGRYEVKPFQLNNLIQQSAGTFGLTRKEITIHLDLAEDVAAIKADMSQMEQLLVNLFINAADAMPTGGHLHIKTRNVAHRDLRDKPYNPKPGRYVHLQIRDTGVGMNQDTMDRMFEPFFTTKGLSRGTGLGLASVYGIVKGHAGYIDVESLQGSGTTFHIYLPASEEGSAPEEASTQEIPKGTETVLIVDDESIVLEVCSNLLEQLGYGTMTAGSGREALEAFGKNHGRIDLFILDMIMPEMGGGETYDRLKAADPGVKVLLSSGYSLDGQAQEILDRGCDGFVQKPFDLEALSRKIRGILDS